MNFIRTWMHRTSSNPQIVALLLILVCFLVAIYTLGKLATPVIAALVIAYLMEPTVSKLVKAKMNRTVATTIMCVVTMVTLIIVGRLIVPLLIDEIKKFIASAPAMVDGLQGTIKNLSDQYPLLITQDQSQSMFDSIRTSIVDYGQELVSVTASNFFNSFLDLILYIVLVPLMTFFFLKDKHQILAWFRGFLPDQIGLASQVWDETNAKVGHYVRAKVAEIIIVSICTWIVFYFMDVPYTLLLALMTGFSVLIPYIGAAAVTFPIAIIAVQEWGLGFDAGMVVIAYGIIQLIDGNILAPLLFAEFLKLHPIAIICAILFFGSIWGIWGLFFSIPIATLLHVVITAWPKAIEQENLEG